MKRIYITLTLILATTLAAMAQVSLRPQVGINFPSFTEEILEGKFKGNAGYQFGADVQLGNVFYVQPGANFQTANLELSDIGDINVSRLNIPVMLGLKFYGPEGDRAFGFRLFAGPNFAFNLNKDLDSALSEVSIRKDDLKNFHLSGMAGAGLDIGILFVDVGYKFGLSNYFDDDITDGTINIFLVNTGLRIGF